MDTLTITHQRFDKSAICVLGIGIAFSFIFAQCLGQDLGYNTGLSPTLNYIHSKNLEDENNYKKYILSKYAGTKISEIDKGIYHVSSTRYFNGKPVRLNIVEISRDINHKLEIEPAIASTTLASKSKITKIAQDNNAIVAINGGYFKPQTGVPLGTLMIDKKVYTGPIYDRVAMGFFEEGYGMARVQLKANINTNKGG